MVRPYLDIWTENDVQHSYLETPEFRSYAAAIGEIIDAHGSEGVTVRGIHEMLGENARREWTLDAIDSLKHVDHFGLLPTRYRRSGERAVRTVNPPKPFFRDYPDHPDAEARTK